MNVPEWREGDDFIWFTEDVIVRIDQITALRWEGSFDGDSVRIWIGSAYEPFTHSGEGAVEIWDRVRRALGIKPAEWEVSGE